ncbi:hypothetical protein M2232_003036 [Bradyrhizobium japonicum]|nr:hypothetical protein [Bradyrhizobium japonicum]
MLGAFAAGCCTIIRDSLPTMTEIAVRSDGTLVVIAPSRDGLVFASDTRLTVDVGSFCDGHTKILEPSPPKRLLLAVTGRRGFHPLDRMFAKDICEYVRTTPREFDFGLVAKAYIEGSNNQIDLKTFDMLALGNYCAVELQKYFASQPAYVPRTNADAFTAHIVLASYDPENQIAIVRSVLLNVNAQNINIEVSLNEHYGVDSEASPVLVGEQPYVLAHVLPVINSFEISESTREALGSFPIMKFKRVGDTSINEAIALASDLINATSQRTNVVPAPSGVGGGVDSRVIR